MNRRTQLTALLISPDRKIAAQFRESTSRTRAFEIAAELQAYPSASQLDSKLRQLRPEVVLVDVATDLNVAGDLIRALTSQKPPVPVIGLHLKNESHAILRSLREGASEFLYAPFDVSIQEAAVARIQKMLEPAGGSERETGRLVAFASTKPGSGASTLAIQTAYALKRMAGKRVLLADMDLHAGTLGFFLKLSSEHSMADLFTYEGRLDHDIWSRVVTGCGGIDVLPGPVCAHTDPLDPSKLTEILEHARSTYDWTVLDLPSIFNRLSLVCVSASDRAFLVSTAELASLHLTRRSVKLLNQLGFDSTKYQVLVNRLESRTDLSSSDLSKIFECHVDKGLPDERLKVERVHTLGEPLDGGTELGRAIEGLATKLMGALPQGTRPQGPTLAPTPAFSHI